MPGLPSGGNRDGRSELGPIGSERHGVTSPTRPSNHQLESRWPDSRLHTPPRDAPCIVLDRTDLLAELLGAPSWDLLRTPHRQGVWFQESDPGPGSPKPGRKERRGQRTCSRLAAVPKQAECYTSFATCTNRKPSPPVFSPAYCQHAAPDSAGEDEDPPPGDKPKSRPSLEGLHPPCPSSVLPADHGRTCTICGTLTPKWGDPWKGAARSPYTWTIRDEEQEDAEWRAVMMNTANCLADVQDFLRMTLLWGPPHIDLGSTVTQGRGRPQVG